MLLPDDEAELARGFGCGNLDEVMQVCHIGTKERLIQMLASTDPEVVSDLIRSIDTTVMMKMMAERNLEDIATMIEEGGDEDDEVEEGAEAVGSVELTSVTPSTYKGIPPAEESLPTSSRIDAPLLGGQASAQENNDEKHAATATGSDVPPGGDAEARIRTMSAEVARMCAEMDKSGLTKWLMETSVSDMLAVTEHNETHFSKAQQKQQDKNFNKAVPSKEFAKLLRQRAELREFVQIMMKRELDRKVAFMKGRKRPQTIANG